MMLPHRNNKKTTDVSCAMKCKSVIFLLVTLVDKGYYLGNGLAVFEIGGVMSVPVPGQLGSHTDRSVDFSGKENPQKEGRQKGGAVPGTASAKGRRVEQQDTTPQEQVAEIIGLLGIPPQTHVAKRMWRLLLLELPLLIIRHGFHGKPEIKQRKAHHDQKRIAR